MLASLRNRWNRLRPARGWAGVFFGAAELQAAMVSPAGHSRAEQPAPTVPLPSEPTETAARWEAAAAALRQQIDPRTYRIVTAVGAEDVLCLVQQLPATNDVELRQMLDLQLDNLAPLPADEVVQGFASLGIVDNQTRALVVIARKEVVNERVAALEAAGLPAEIVTVDAVAVFRELLRRGALPVDDRCHLLVVVTATAAHQLFYRRAMLVAVRSLLLPSAEGEMVALGEELQRTWVSVALAEGGGEPGAVLVASVDAGTRAVAERLCAICGGQMLPEERVPVVAMALCPTHDDGAEPLNLLPAEWRQRRRRTQLRRNLIRGGIAAAALYVVVIAVWGVFLFWRRSQLSGLQAEIRRLQPEYRQAREMHSEMTAMRRQMDTKYSALEVLREVSVRLPESLKLSAFIFRKDQKVTLRGQSQTPAAALEFIGQLEKCDLFGEVKTVTMSTPPGGALTKFEVDCRLQTAASSPGGRSWR